MNEEEKKYLTKVLNFKQRRLLAAKALPKIINLSSSFAPPVKFFLLPWIITLQFSITV